MLVDSGSGSGEWSPTSSVEFVKLSSVRCHLVPFPDDIRS